jgi:peptidyl-prolyl cis-trans isomerase C
MRGLPCPWGAALALALSGLPALAQNPPAAKPATPPPAAAKPAPAPAPAVSPTAVAASVNGEPIYEAAVQNRLERVPPAQRAQARADLINYMVDKLAVDQHVRQAGVTVEKAEVDKVVAEIRAEWKKGGRDYEKWLKDMRFTEEEIRAGIAEELRWDKYVNGRATDKALKELFDSNKDLFDGTTVRAWHILLSPPAGDEKAAAAAKARLAELKKGIESQVGAGLAKLPATADKLAREKARGNLVVEAFSAAAKTKSECSGTKPNGGEIGWVGKFRMAPEFGQAAFALQPYQISDPVKTRFGYHLILVTDRKPGREVKFEDAKEMVKDIFGSRLFESLAAQTRARSRVVVNPPPK